MAGNNEFLITNIVDANAFSELERLNEGFESAKTSYMSFVKEIAKGSSASPKTFEELTAKANGFTASLVKLNGASERMNSIQQEQAAILKKVSAQLGNASGLSKLDALMGRFTKSVEAASEALGRLSSRASEAKDAQIQSAQGAQQSAQAMAQATQSLGNAEVNYDRLTKTIIEYNSEVEKLSSTNARHKVEIDSVSSSMKLVERDFKTGKMSVDDYTKRIGELKLKYEQLKAATQQNSALIRNHAKAIVSTSGSYYEMNAAMLEFQKRYKALNEADRNSTLGQDLVKQANILNTKLKEIDAQFGNYQRNVGNYSSAWNGLGMSIQQIGRELPSLAMGWNTFFLAISNNLPMLTDELARAKREYKELTAQGQKATPVWKQVLGSVLSWQTALVVGITVLSMYGKEIMEWVGSLFKGNAEARKSVDIQKELNAVRQEGAKNAQEEITRINLLYNATQDANRSMEERRKAVDELQKQYPSYFGNMSEEEVLAGKAADSYARLSQSIIASAKARAAQDKMTENARIILENEQKIAEAYIRREKAVENAERAEKDYNENHKKVNPEAALFLALDKERAKEYINSIDEEIAGYRRAIYEMNKVQQELANSVNIGDLLFGNTDDTKQSADDYVSYIKKITEDLNKSRIELMEEGRAKELAQIDADYAARMAEIKGNTEEEIELRKNLEALKAAAVKEANEKYNQELLEIEKGNLQNRLASLRGANEKELDERLRLQLELNGMMRDAELAEAEKSGADASAIIDKYEKEKNDIVMGNLRERMGIIRSYSDMAEREQEADALKEKSVLERQYRDGEMSRTEYERRMYEIGLSYSKARLQTLINEARQQLALSNLPESKRKELEQRISGLQAQLSALGDKEWVDTRGLEGFNDALREMQGTARESLGDTADLFSPFYTVFSGITEAAKRMGKNINEIDFKDFWNNLDPSERAGLILSGFSQIASGITSVMSDIFSGRIDKLEEEQEANEEAYEAELERIESLQESGAISTEEAEARKRAAEDKTKAKEEQIAKKKQELETKQARWDKANSIIQAGIATALAVTKALPNLVLAALVGAMGAAQIAVIASKQIPKYARGTDDHPGGLAIVGDGGRREGVVTGKGLFVTPDKPTLVDLPRHAQVIPDLSGIVSADGLRSDYGLLERQMREKREAGVVVNVDNHFAPLERRMDENTRQLRDIRKLMKAKGRRNDYNWIASRV